ncbi:MAG: hypothetical protein J7L07_02935 [Candidatus Odinarchaeota archaeon]|nr:hypothetical protein [Candidatus Odinarchaeota archaeon]
MQWKDKENICSFVKDLLDWWYRTNEMRNYPWRNTTSLYEFIIAELLLQRTRRSAVLNVYKKFVEKYPTAEKLAKADLKEVSNVIYPLGLRKRAETLIKLGKALADEKHILDNYKALIKLPGIGDYIASMVLSVFFRKNNIVAVDKNVARIFIRLFGISPHNKERPQDDKLIRNMANRCIPKDKSREYTLALLDLGWEICIPKNPKCEICPLKKICHFVKNKGNRK